MHPVGAPTHKKHTTGDQLSSVCACFRGWKCSETFLCLIRMRTLSSFDFGVDIQPLWGPITTNCDQQLVLSRQALERDRDCREKSACLFSQLLEEDTNLLPSPFICGKAPDISAATSTHEERYRAHWDNTYWFGFRLQIKKESDLPENTHPPPVLHLKRPAFLRGSHSQCMTWCLYHEKCAPAKEHIFSFTLTDS
jgi:hypothetical protein